MHASWTGTDGSGGEVCSGSPIAAPVLRRLVSANSENASRIRAFGSVRVFGHDGKTPDLIECAGMEKLDTEKTVKILNTILEQELAGVVRYTHYALMVTGPNRLPIVEFMKAQASGVLGPCSTGG